MIGFSVVLDHSCRCCCSDSDCGWCGRRSGQYVTPCAVAVAVVENDNNDDSVAVENSLDNLYHTNRWGTWMMMMIRPYQYRSYQLFCH